MVILLTLAAFRHARMVSSATIAPRDALAYAQVSLATGLILCISTASTIVLLHTSLLTRLIANACLTAESILPLETLTLRYAHMCVHRITGLIIPLISA